MAFYIYRRKRSTGARELAEALGGMRVRSADLLPPSPSRGDVLVCWGESHTDLPRPWQGIALNGAPVRNKFTDAQVLRQAGVPTIEVSQTRPLSGRTVGTTPGPDPAAALWSAAQDSAEQFADLAFARGPVSIASIRELQGRFTSLATALGTPPPAPVVAATWLPRMNNHTGGLDLLTPPPTPDFWVKKENITQEYRIHAFAGRSIRAGQKAVREGFRLGTVPGAGGHVANSWVRSFDGGWRIVYDNFESSRSMRDLANAAVTALGLQFGAVDIGQKADGSLIVLEVNRAPGLEGGTVTSYATAIRAHASA